MTSARPPLPDAEALLIDPAQAGVHPWADGLVILPLTALTLRLLALAFDGALSLDEPLTLLFAALVVTLVVLATRLGLSAVRRAAARRKPLVRDTIATVQRIETVSAEGQAQTAVVEVVERGLLTTLAPTHLQIVLYDPRHDGYLPDAAAHPIAATAPFAVWLQRQPIARPLALTAAPLPRARESPQRDQQGALLVPLGKQGWIVIGERRGGEGYTAAERRSLHWIAQAAALALQQAALNEAQAQRARELEALHWIAQSVDFSTALDDLLELIYTQLKRLMRLPIFYIALIDPQTDHFAFTFHTENDRRRYPDHTWPATQGLTGLLVKHNMTLRTGDYRAECRRRGVTPDGPETLHAWMGTALTVGDRSIGVMIAATFSPDLRFTAAEETLFVTVAAYAAVLLERHGLTDTAPVTPPIPPEEDRAVQAEFLAAIVHELKQPITAIQGYANLLSRRSAGPLTAAQAEFVDSIQSGVIRMDEMVQDFLDLACIDAGLFELECEPVNPREITQEAAAALRREIAAKGQALDLVVADELPTLTGDRRRLRQVLIHLLSNAHQYTPEGGQITLRVAPTGTNGASGVQWQVSDTGIGMTQKEIEQAFGHFFRARQGQVRSTRGLGLGLTITRTIVELHGGEMQIQSEYGQGSTFSVTLPAASG